MEGAERSRKNTGEILRYRYEKQIGGHQNIQQKRKEREKNESEEKNDKILRDEKKGK